MTFLVREVRISFAPSLFSPSQLSQQNFDTLLSLPQDSSFLHHHVQEQGQFYSQITCFCHSDSTDKWNTNDWRFCVRFSTRFSRVVVSCIAKIAPNYQSYSSHCGSHCSFIARKRTRWWKGTHFFGGKFWTVWCCGDNRWHLLSHILIRVSDT